MSISNAIPYVRRSKDGTDSMVIGLGGIARYIIKPNNLPSVSKCHVQGHFGSGSFGLVQRLLFQTASGCTGLYHAVPVPVCEKRINVGFDAGPCSPPPTGWPRKPHAQLQWLPLPQTKSSSKLLNTNKQNTIGVTYPSYRTCDKTNSH